METKMPNNWKKYKLHQVAEIKYGKDHKLLKNGSIPVYGSGGIMRYGDNFLYDKPSILIPRKGTLSNLFYIDKPFWSVDTMFWSKIAEGTLPKYLFYNLKTLDLASMDVGSAVPSLTTELLNKIEITLPPLHEQQAIAEILSSLDDKIELNLQTNKTLEAMANALYKHWFVDFGPFKDGKFIESELGMIPDGWEVNNLNQLCEMKYGTMPKAEKLQTSGYAIFSGYKIVGYYPEYNCEKGDVIVVARGVGGTGDVKRTPEKCFLTNLSISLKPKQNTIDRRILYYYLKKNGLDYLRTGSAQPQITINDLNSVVVLNPPNAIQKEFLEFFDILLDTLGNNINENQTLKQTRDYLLPKLISGEIQVKQATKLAKQVL